MSLNRGVVRGEYRPVPRRDRRAGGSYGGRAHGVGHEYGRIGIPALKAANLLQRGLAEKGYRLYFRSPTNQVFVIIENEKLEPLAEKVVYEYAEKYDDDHTVIRFCTSWATDIADVKALLSIL